MTRLDPHAPRAAVPPLGLIAGEGVLPRLVARGMRAAGRTVVCAAFRGSHDPALAAECDRLVPVGVARLGAWIRVLRRAGATEAVMVGRVAKARVHDPLRLVRNLPDLRALRVWYRRLRHDRRNAAVLAAVCDELADAGIVLIDSTTYIPEHLASVGTLGRVEPGAAQRADVAFGIPLVRAIAALDVGQSVAVMERDVVAVEAVEGTDAMMVRAGALCRRRGWTLVKTAKADHDRRADVPTIGIDTIRRAVETGCGCIAVGAGRVILLDRPAVVAEADRAGIALVGFAEP